MPANDINRRSCSVGALTDLFESRIRCSKVHQKCTTHRRGRLRFIFATEPLRGEHTECRNNDDLTQLKNTHLVTDRKKLFETMISIDAVPASGCRKPKEPSRTEARSEDELKVNHVAHQISDNVENPTVVMTDLLEETDNAALIQNDPPDQTLESEEPDEPISSHQFVKQENKEEARNRYKRKPQTQSLSEIRSNIKKSIVQEYNNLSLDSMGELDGMPDDEEALECVNIIRSWSQQNLTVILGDDDCEIEEEQLKVIPDHNLPKSEIETVILGDDDCKIVEEPLKVIPDDNLPESEIESCINGIREEYQTLTKFSQTKGNTTSPEGSGRFVKNEMRLSGSRRSLRKQKSNSMDTTKYCDGSEWDRVVDYTKEKDKSAVRNSNTSSSAYESGEEEPDLDIFGFTNFNDYVLEAYNPNYNPKFYENILCKISLYREMIDIPDVEDINESNLKRQSDLSQCDFTGEGDNADFGSTVDGEAAVNKPRIYENCVPSDSDVVEHDLMNVKNVEDATSKMTQHIYENHMVTKNDNVIGGAYLDGNLNRRIEIICDSNTEPEKRLTLDVPTRLDSQLSSPTPKHHHIIKELIETEQTYIDNMEYVIHQYLKYFTNHPKRRRELPEIYKIFGNIEALYVSSQEVLEDLIKCDSSIDCIANVFLKSKRLFELYSEYLRNKSQTQAILETYMIPLTKRQHELNDKKSCDSYLLTPVQRPGRYKLLLENLQKELTKFGEKNKNLEAAIRFVDKNILVANTLLAIDSIGGCPKDLRKFGSFLMKETFNVKRKYKSVVFLFQGIIVFTTDNKMKPDTYEYKNSIDANNMSLKTHSKSTTFTVSDFEKCKTTLDDTRFNFEIEASSEHVCKKWVNQIGTILWNQMEHFRQLQENQSEPTNGNVYATKSEIRKPTQKRSVDRTNSVFYIPQLIKDET